MTTVTVDKEGKVGLPEEILSRSHNQPGARLVALAHEGKIVLLDKNRFWQRVEQPGQKIIVQFQRSLDGKEEMEGREGIGGSYESVSSCSIRFVCCFPLVYFLHFDEVGVCA